MDGVCRRLRRNEAAQYITERSAPCSPATLAGKAVRGGGPEFELFGRIPLYPTDKLDAWIAARLSKPAATTAQHAEQRQQNNAA